MKKIVSCLIMLELVLALVSHVVAQAPEIWNKSPCNPIWNSIKNDSWPFVIRADDQYIMYIDRYDPPQHIEYMTATNGLNWTNQGVLIYPGQNGQFNWHDVSVKGCVFWDDNAGEYRMYYGANDGSQWRVVGLARSDNAIEWYDMGQVMNVGASGEWDNYVISPGHVLYDAVKGEYLMLYIGVEDYTSTKARVGLATSPDGLNWTKWAGNPVISEGADSEFDGSHIGAVSAFFEEGGKYVCYYLGVSGTGVYSLGKAESDDAINWTKLGQVLVPNLPWEYDRIIYGSIIDMCGVKTMYYQAGYPPSNYAIGIAQLEDHGSDLTQPYTSDDCTVLLLHFNEGSGNIAYDESNNGNDGTIYGAEWIPNGKFGGALHFEGYADSYGDSINIIPNDMSFLAGPHTLEAWIYPLSIGTQQTIMDLSGGHDQIPMYILPDGQVTFRLVRNNPDYSEQIQSNTQLQPNNWYHLAGVWDGCEMSIYVNGQKENSRQLSWSPTVPPTNFMEIGKVSTGIGPRSFFNGYIDEVRISSIARSFFLIEKGSVKGSITADFDGLQGIPVDLYDSSGDVVTSTTTDSVGWYQFVGLDYGNYVISISTPLGYQAEEESKEIEVKCLQEEVNFQLTKLEITPRQRSRGYWAHQLCRALWNWPKDYTLDDFSNFASHINQHFNQNQVNPVDFVSVPQPADQNDSLKVLKELLHMCNTGEREPFTKRLAKAQLIAMMLNVVSGKVHQTYKISSDDRTVSQAITYCDMLVNDEIDPPDGTCRYLRASLILGLANLGLTVPSGMIPEDVIEIAYKTHNQVNIPDGFSLSQNYPNPFNPETEISYTLPRESNVKLVIYNVKGQKVKVLVDEYQSAGYKSVRWDGKDEKGSPVASGVYFYKLSLRNEVISKKMLLLK